MDPETIAYVIAVMVLMFSALNTIVLHDLFKRMKANSEDLNAFKKIKWRWVLFYFTDVLVLVGIFFLTPFDYTRCFNFYLYKLDYHSTIFV